MANAMRTEDREPMDIASRVEAVLAQMTLEEKAGQLNSVDASSPDPSSRLADDIRAGRIGAVLNQVELPEICALQHIALEESRLGIPLLFSRDVIHGFNTVFPLPLGQAASWNPDIVREGARIAAHEAAAVGIRWTFAPMVDISRDARWGRIAESLGEDPYLASVLGAAMVEGFQGEDLSAPGSIAACVKHFAGYGASEAGRDYAATTIPDNEMRNVYLPPFKAALKAGAATFMTSFGDIDGIPATGNDYLINGVLRDEMGFDGLMISDWDSIGQLIIHGFAEDPKEAARIAAEAGVDMDMMSSAFVDYLPKLVREGLVPEDVLDEMARRVLTLKFTLGVVDDPYADIHRGGTPDREKALALAHEAAVQSLVLLKNEGEVLPLDFKALDGLALIGPLADQPVEQMGTWVFDGEAERSVTPAAAFKDALGSDRLRFVPGLTHSRDTSHEAFKAAVHAAEASDAVVLCLGEEAILSGEAHSRADITLPGAQVELARALKATGKPVIGVVLAGRPLVLSNVDECFDALIYAWHPGNRGGTALVDVISGKVSPSGKLPLSFPKSVGQIPIHYNRKNSGRPAEPDKVVHIDDIPVGAPQTSLGMSSFHLDDGYEPAYVFGHGLSYTQFHYGAVRLSTHEMGAGEALEVTVELSNTGEREAVEIAQLYIRDRAASLTRPVRELKAFQRVSLKPGERTTLRFALAEADLAFSRRDKSFGAEPGMFDVWVGGDSKASAHAEFRLTAVSEA